MEREQEVFLYRFLAAYKEKVGEMELEEALLQEIKAR